MTDKTDSSGFTVSAEHVTGKEVEKQIVDSFVTAAGMIELPDEMRDDIAKNEGISVDDVPKMVDVFSLRFKTFDDEEHRFLAEWQDAALLMLSLENWLQGMHDLGRCGCGEHE